MKLVDYCYSITGLDWKRQDTLPQNNLQLSNLQQNDLLRNDWQNDLRQNDIDHLGHRIMCPEYSINHVEVKTFPVEETEDIFILCWRLSDKGLYANIKPYKKNFVYHTGFNDGDRTQLHTHDYIELAYVIEGEFSQRIMGKDVLFKKGEICLIDKNCIHQDFLYASNSIILFIGLANAAFDEAMVDNIEERGILEFLRKALMKQKDTKQFLHFKPKLTKDETDVRLEEMLLLLLREMEYRDKATRYICKGILIRLLHHISTNYEFYLTNEQRKTMNWLVFEEISKYINENYADVTIKDLKERFHFNEDYFNRLLKSKTGMTYSEYVQNIRLMQSERLLRTTSLTIDEIADKIGYNNKGYFYKIFVERYKMTPAKYRRMIS